MEVAGRKLETEEGSDAFCEPCGVENKKTEANGACRECKEYMCTTCFQHHLKGKLCRNHVLLSSVDLSSMSLDISKEDVEKCGKHDNERIKFYCGTHDIVGCGDCIVLGHASCKPKYIRDVAKTFKNGDEFKNIIQKMDMLESYRTEVEETNNANKNEIDTMNNKALKDIRLFRSDINKYLDEAEANILLEVKKVTSKNSEVQRKLEQDVQSLKAEFEAVKQKLNTQLYADNALFINAVSCKPMLDGIEKLYMQLTGKYSIKGLEFVRDKEISGILQNAHKFGSFKTYSVPVARIKRAKFVVGARVRRGPDWKWEKQDAGGLGIVTGFGGKGWATVKWDKGDSHSYRIGHQNAFDLETVDI